MKIQVKIPTYPVSKNFKLIVLLMFSTIITKMQESNHNWTNPEEVRIQSVQVLAQDFRIGSQDQVEQASTNNGSENEGVKTYSNF